MFTLNWFFSKTVRQASEMRRQVRMLLNEQRDLLKPEAIQKIQGGVDSMTSVLEQGSGKEVIKTEMNRLEKVANDNLIPYPGGSVRENIKEILVAITTIMAFTSFFLQLTKIPTGSMQPTLFGITHENLLDQPEIKIPNFLVRVKDYWVWGIQYNWFVAPEDGEFESFEPPRSILPFIKTQRFRFAGQWHTIWLPGDGLFGSPETGRMRATIRPGVVKKGEYVFAVKIYAGDHLLVDRFTYNFRRPERGEIIVFKTRGIPRLPQDQLYIKRLVGLPNETIRIGNDRHLVVDGRRLDAATRHFEMIYGAIDDAHDPLVHAKTREEWEAAVTSRKPPYRGHINQKVAHDLYSDPRDVAEKFPDGTEEFHVREGHLLPMGDNQMNSSDGRVFGDFDRRNLIGRCWFVYWPFTERFGWGYR